MDDAKARLQENVEKCLKTYEAWSNKKNDAALRETLQESIHELRKVASRLEIEIAISERDNMSEKPLAIPPHRSSSKHKGAVESILPDDGNTAGNSSAKKESGGSRKPRGRRPAPRTQAD